MCAFHGISCNDIDIYDEFLRVFVIVFWSAKGGSGSTVVAAFTARAMASAGQRTLLIDADGDQPAVFGFNSTTEMPTIGLAQWSESSKDVPARSLLQVSIDVLLNLRLVISGLDERVTLSSDAFRRLAEDFSGTSMVIDVGDNKDAACAAMPFAHASYCVIRPCYLAASRLRRQPVPAHGLVVIEESGRTLNAEDLSNALGVPIAARMKWDSAVARAVDAGRLGVANIRSTKTINEFAHLLLTGEQP